MGSYGWLGCLTGSWNRALGIVLNKFKQKPYWSFGFIWPFLSFRRINCNTRTLPDKQLTAQQFRIELWGGLLYCNWLYICLDKGTTVWDKAYRPLNCRVLRNWVAIKLIVNRSGRNERQIDLPIFTKQKIRDVDYLWFLLPIQRKATVKRDISFTKFPERHKTWVSGKNNPISFHYRKICIGR